MSSSQCAQEDYSAIADGPFAPLYPFYARLAIERTGINTGHLLDIGSNQGNLGFAAWKLGEFSHLSLLDIDGAALEKAGRISRELGIADSCSTVCCSVENMTLPDCSVDLVISRGSMSFWEDQRRAIKEIFRVLKPNASAYIGGGLGPRSIRKKLKSDMQRVQKGEPFDPKRCGSKTLPDQEYVSIFQELGCSYAIINSDDEGHWLIFSKKEGR